MPEQGWSHRTSKEEESSNITSSQKTPSSLISFRGGLSYSTLCKLSPYPESSGIKMLYAAEVSKTSFRHIKRAHIQHCEPCKHISKCSRPFSSLSLNQTHPQCLGTCWQTNCNHRRRTDHSSKCAPQLSSPLLRSPDDSSSC